MRTIVLKTVTGALLGAAAAGHSLAAPPVFQGSGKAAPAASETKWGLSNIKRMIGWQGAQPRPMGMSQQPMAPANYQPFTPQGQPAPSTRTRIQQAFTQNRLTAAVASVTNSSTRQREQSAPLSDELSLNKPVQTPQSSMYVALAGIAEQAGNTASARELFNKALQADPSDLAALKKLGRLEDRLGNFEAAEMLYRRAIAVNSNHAGAFNDLALCCARQSKLQESASALERAIVLRPAKTLYRNNIAKVLIAAGDKQRAVAHLAAVHGPAVAQFNVAQMLAASGRTSEALSHYRQAIAIDPGFELAQAMLAQYDPDQATPETPQIATRPKLPALTKAPEPSVVSVAPSLEDQPELPTLAMPSAPADDPGPEFPRLLPPVTD